MRTVIGVSLAFIEATLALLCAVADVRAGQVVYDFGGTVKGFACPHAEEVLSITRGSIVEGTFTLDLDAPLGSHGQTFAYYDNAILDFSGLVDGLGFTYDSSAAVYIKKDWFEMNLNVLYGDGARRAVNVAIGNYPDFMFPDLLLGNAANLRLDGFSRVFTLYFWDLPDCPSCGASQAVAVDWQVLTPEPATLGLLVVGFGAIWAKRRRKA